MNRVLKQAKYAVIIAVMLVLLLVFTAACSTFEKPEVSVKGFFEALKNNEVATAGAYLVNSEGDLNFDNEEQEKVVGQIFSSINYEVLSTKIDGDTATVRSKVSSADMAKLMNNMVEELMPKLMEMALNGEEEDMDKKTDELTEQFFNEAFANPDLPRYETEIDIKLVKSKEKKKWLIETDDELVNAVTGNAAKAFEGMNVEGQAEGNTEN